MSLHPINSPRPIIVSAHSEPDDADTSIREEITKARHAASGSMSVGPQRDESLQEEVSNYLEQQGKPDVRFLQHLDQEGSELECQHVLLQLTMCATDHVEPDRAIGLGVTAICRMMNCKSVDEDDMARATYFATEVLRRFGADEQKKNLMQTGLMSGLPQKPFVTDYINKKIQKM